MTVETRAATIIQSQLPDEWLVELDPRTESHLTIAASSTNRLSFDLFTADYRQLPGPLLVDRIKEKQESTKNPVLFLSDFIGPSLRRLLTANGINFADTTGWISIQNKNPMVYINKAGAERSPDWITKQSSSIARLNGPGASKVICALAETDTPIGIRALAAKADVAPGTATKVLKTLTNDGVVARDRSGRILRIEKRALIERWVQDYGFLTANKSVRYYIAPRGISKTLEQLQSFENIAFTGSVAARALLPEGTVSPVPLTLISLYATANDAIERELTLIPSDQVTYNLVIAEPQRSEILYKPGSTIRIAPMPLVLADLLTLPNRGNSEVNQLMTLFANTDPTWSDYDD